MTIDYKKLLSFSVHTSKVDLLELLLDRPGFPNHVQSAFDVPGFPRSAMDGYAVRGEDTFGASSYDPIEFRVLGQALPGHPFGHHVI